MGDSHGLRRLLRYTLGIGNYMNGGTPKGAAHGIMLKSLTKLIDSRGGLGYKERIERVLEYI